MDSYPRDGQYNPSYVNEDKKNTKLPPTQLYPSTSSRSSSVKCRYFMNSGYCFYGNACQFAHVSLNNGVTADNKRSQENLYGEDPIFSSLKSPVFLPGANKHPSLSSDQSHPNKSNEHDQSNEILQQHFRRMRLMQPNVDNSKQHQNQKHMKNLSPLQFSVHKASKTSYFMAQQIRMELQKQRMSLMATSKDLGLSEGVENYHSLYPLEDLKVAAQGQRLLGYSSSCYRVMNSKDGLHYCLRRIHGFRLLNPKAVSNIEQWKKVLNSNIVQMKEVFTTKAFGDTSLVFIYNYYPGAETLLSRHFVSDVTSPSNMESGSWSGKNQSFAPKKSTQKVMPERLIWSYVIQLSAAIRHIHSQGLSCRIIDPSKVLLIGNTRLRLNCVGILDAITSDANPTTPSLMSHYQQEDLVALGKLILALACYSIEAVHRDNIQDSLEFVTRNYSNDLKTLIWHLLSSQASNNPHNINEVMPVIGARFYSQLDSTQARCDLLENELTKEMDNGRLLRIVAKLGTILERAELNMDAEWSETGDRYLLKLFRDYLFHQVTETGNAWIDFAHIVSVLNKLDAGSSDRICLSSRDEQSILVVSYHDLKACLETAFSELNPSNAVL